MSEKFQVDQNDLNTVFNYIYGNWVHCVTYAFAYFNIADLLLESDKDIHELSTETQTNPNLMHRYLRCAASIGLITIDYQLGLYKVTKLGLILSNEHPNSKKAAALLNGSQYRYAPWGQLVDVLKNGTSHEISESYQNGTLEFLKDKPDLHYQFHLAMSNLSNEEDDVLVQHFPFDNFENIIDIGGGQGNFIKTILKNFPSTNGTLFELEQTIPTINTTESENIAERFSIKTGNFFEKIPVAFDLYILKNVIHNSPFDKQNIIIQNIFNAMTYDNNPENIFKRRLLIIENIVNENNEFELSKWLDLNFMILLDSKEFTINELNHLLNNNGLEIVKVHDTKISRKIIEIKVINR